MERRKRILAAAIGLAGGLVACAAAPGCGPGRGTSRPNLLFISIDTIRRDHCSVYGYALPTTPRMVQLAEQGARFEQAYAPMGTTGPSHATMFTGLHPRRHGVTKNGEILDVRIPRIAQVLRSYGYRTAAVVSSYTVSARFGLQHGFGVFDDRFKPRVGGLASDGPDGARPTTRQADDVTENAIEQLEAARAEPGPFFLWVHYWDPHTPYEPPPELRERFRPARSEAEDLEQDLGAYDAEIAFTDREVGRLIDHLDGSGLANDTLVVVVGDHGEAFMEHGVTGHGLTLHEEVVLVPLLMRWPGRIEPGMVVPEPVQLVDLAPTILELLGLRFDGFEPAGISLVAVLERRATPDPERPVYLQRRWFKRDVVQGISVRGPEFAVRAGTWKYIEAGEDGRFELYDLSRDPGETRNLVDVEAEKRAELATLLQGWREVTHPIFDARPTISESDLKALEALGYVP
jgi:arylsulfatase A-like enzyme